MRNPAGQVRDDTLAFLREQMVERQLRASGIRDERVLRAMAEVPRHVFVPDSLAHVAYDDRALPIGHGQTISQPLIVAMMLEALELKGDERVLDVGTGSGYQAALLDRLAWQVYSIEIIPELVHSARAALALVGATNVKVIVSDGSVGFPRAAPYQGIVVAAAAPEVPEPLLEQLDEGGRLVIPVGPLRGQSLIRVRKSGKTSRRETLTLCSFVPLVGERGWR